MKLLIDECLHVSLVGLAHSAGHRADHVNYLGLGSLKDWQILRTAIEQEYALVTNNRLDFLALYRRQPLHSGLVILVPNVTPVRQRELFRAVLQHVGSRDLTNTVVEVSYRGNRIECLEYLLPGSVE